MKILEVSNLRWLDEEQTAIYADILFEEIGEFIPFTIREDDVVDHGKELWKMVIKRRSSIAPYVNPVTPEMLAEEAAREFEMNLTELVGDSLQAKLQWLQKAQTLNPTGLTVLKKLEERQKELLAKL